MELGTKKVAQMDADRWVKVLLCWQPHGSRKVGHPKLPWDDCINAMFDDSEQEKIQDWLILALDNDTWETAGARYNDT